MKYTSLILAILCTIKADTTEYVYMGYAMGLLSICFSMTYIRCVVIESKWWNERELRKALADENESINLIRKHHEEAGA